MSIASVHTAPFGIPAGATGTWRSETEFRLDVNVITNINHYTLAITFLPEAVTFPVNRRSENVSDRSERLEPW